MPNYPKQAFIQNLWNDGTVNHQSQPSKLDESDSFRNVGLDAFRKRTISIGIVDPSLAYPINSTGVFPSHPMVDGNNTV